MTGQRAVDDLPGNQVLSKIFNGLNRQLIRRLWHLTVNGRENVPKTGAAILAPNHLAFCDSMFVPGVLDRPLWFIGKGEYMDDWKTRKLFPAMGMIPVDRRGGSAAAAALDAAATVLDAGELFGIYPEGTRSRDRKLYKGRTGAARLSVRCDVPVIPVGLKGTPEIQPPGSVVMKPFKKCTVSFGEPMCADHFGDGDDPRTLRYFTDALMHEISLLSGQTYVHEYAGKSSQQSRAQTSGPEPEQRGQGSRGPARSLSRPTMAAGPRHVDALGN